MFATTVSVGLDLGFVRLMVFVAYWGLLGCYFAWCVGCTCWWFCWRAGCNRTGLRVKFKSWVVWFLGDFGGLLVVFKVGCWVLVVFDACDCWCVICVLYLVCFRVVFGGAVLADLWLPGLLILVGAAGFAFLGGLI